MPDMALFFILYMYFLLISHGKHSNEKSKINRINLKFYR